MRNLPIAPVRCGQGLVVERSILRKVLSVVTKLLYRISRCVLVTTERRASAPTLATPYAL